MSTTPTYSDELQFIGWTDSSRNGPRVTFALPSRDDLQAFIGAEGARFAAVLVRLGDDEQPVPPPRPSPKYAEPVAPKADHALSKWAALRCVDPKFWHWINLERGEVRIFNCNDAAQWIRDTCEVESRAEFDTDSAAAECFKDRVIRPWQRHCVAAGIT